MTHRDRTGDPSGHWAGRREAYRHRAPPRLYFTALLDGMDSGTALSYSSFSGRNPWSVVSPQFWPPMWSVIRA